MRCFCTMMMASAALLSACRNGAASQTELESVSDWAGRSVLYEVNIRQYTPEGTFKAFESHLPRLRELGVDILWLMPVNPISEAGRKGTLGSYYAVADYCGVNEQFGTEADLHDLVSQAHAMGFKVILDWVANHTGCDNVWTREHPDWYVKGENGSFSSPYDWTDTYELDYGNAEMRKGMIEAMKYWLREYNVDGFRCDVAYEVPKDFWDEARPELESVKPVLMLAESEKPEYQEGRAFDMCYNWPLKNVFFDVANGRAGAAALDSLVDVQLRQFPADNILLNHLTNHDLNSWDGSEIERFGEATRAFAVLTYTLPGMPLLYTGQEVGMDKRLEFFEKDSVGDWSANEWTAFYCGLNRLRHECGALGAYQKGFERLDLGRPELFAFRRTCGESSVVVVANLSDHGVDVAVPEPVDVSGYRSPFGGQDGALPASMAPWGYKVLVK